MPLILFPWQQGEARNSVERCQKHYCTEFTICCHSHIKRAGKLLFITSCFFLYSSPLLLCHSVQVRPSLSVFYCTLQYSWRCLTSIQCPLWHRSLLALNESRMAKWETKLSIQNHKTDFLNGAIERPSKSDIPWEETIGRCEPWKMAWIQTMSFSSPLPTKKKEGKSSEKWLKIKL